MREEVLARKIMGTVLEHTDYGIIPGDDHSEKCLAEVTSLLKLANRHIRLSMIPDEAFVCEEHPLEEAHHDDGCHSPGILMYDALRMIVEGTLEDTINGLLVDGGHHKQWYLEQIAQGLGYGRTQIKQRIGPDYDFEEGIAP